MKDFLNSDAMTLIVFFLILLIAVSISIILFKTLEINRSIVKGKFKLTGQVEIDSEQLKSATAVITISNRTLQHVNLISCGVCYNKRLFNFLSEHKASKEMPIKEKIYVPTQDCLILNIEITKLREIVETGKRIKTIRVYAQDNLGHISKLKTRGIRKYITDIIKLEKMQARLKEKKPEPESAEVEIIEPQQIVQKEPEQIEEKVESKVEEKTE